MSLGVVDTSAVTERELEIERDCCQASYGDGERVTQAMILVTSDVRTSKMHVACTSNELGQCRTRG